MRALTRGPYEVSHREKKFVFPFLKRPIKWPLEPSFVVYIIKLQVSRFTLNIEGEGGKKGRKKRKKLAEERRGFYKYRQRYSSVANFSEKPKQYWSGRTEQLVGFTIFNVDNTIAFDEIFCLARAQKERHHTFIVQEMTNGENIYAPREK